MVISASCGLEPTRVVHYKPTVDEAIRLSGGSPRQLVLQREEWPGQVAGSDLVWQDHVPGCPPHDCVPVGSDDPLYILYTRWEYWNDMIFLHLKNKYSFSVFFSGTTGQPKGVQHPTGCRKLILSNKYKKKQNIY